MARTMKDSGVEWIGEIPTDWEINKVKVYCNSIFAGGTPVSNNPLYWDGDIKWIPSGSCHNCRITEAPKTITIEGLEKSSTKLIPANTALLAMTGASCGNTGYLTFEACANQSVTAYVENKKRCNSLFLWYLLQAAKEYVLTFATGGAQGGINVENCKNFLIPIVPLPEQEKIAEFLDEKCGAIDEIISKTEQSIEEYKKLKQSVITKAVTKGIRPNRPMKDSNIEWIGEIPQDWEIKKFRNILKERTEKNVPIKSTERLSLSIDLGVTLYAEKTTNLDRFKDDFEQYKIAHEGDLVMNSMNMIIGAVGVSKYYGCVSPVYYTWYDETPNHTTAKYCEYLLRCKTIKKVLFALGRGIYAIERGDDRVNTCRLKISRDDLKNLKLPLPSLDEQAEIINYLDEKCAEIDTLIEKKQQFLTEMANYKKSLIYEYITGKKEVA